MSIAIILLNLPSWKEELRVASDDSLPETSLRDLTAKEQQELGESTVLHESTTLALLVAKPCLLYPKGHGRASSSTSLRKALWRWGMSRRLRGY